MKCVVSEVLFDYWISNPIWDVIIIHQIARLESKEASDAIWNVKIILTVTEFVPIISVRRFGRQATIPRMRRRKELFQRNIWIKGIL